MAGDSFEEVDSNYLLELNLQRIRLELIKLLENGEKKECFTCNKLKCICKVKESVKSSTISNCCSSLSTMSSISKITDSSENNEVNHLKKNNSITNKSYEEIQAWVQSCTSEKEIDIKSVSKNVLEKGIDVTWPPTQTSIWNDDAVPIQQGSMQKQSTVHEFFKKFGEAQNVTIPEVIAGVINLQAIYITDKKAQIKYKNALIQKIRTAPKYATEYSYF